MPHSEYTVYSIRGLSAGVFGDSYVVIAGEDNDDIVNIEWHILTKKPEETLISKYFSISPKNFPPEVIEEIGSPYQYGASQAKLYAELNLLELLEDRAKELGRPDIASMYPRLELIDKTTMFVRSAVSGSHFKSVKQIHEKTMCGELKRKLSLTNQLPGTKPPTAF